MYQPDHSIGEGRWSYLRVAQLLRQEILNGTYRPGRRLPGEPVLAQRFGVGRVTVAKALEVLQQSNLVFRVRGSGTYVQRDVARGAVSLTIGYFVPDISVLRSSPSGTTLETVHQYLESQGHTVRFLTRSEIAGNGEPAACIRRMVRAGTLNAMVVSTYMEPDLLRNIGEILPTVYILNDMHPDNVLCVPVDFGLGYFAATRHLLDLGHRHIGLFGGNQHASIGYRAHQAFRLALQLAGLDPEASPVCQCGFSPNRFPASSEAMLREHTELTGMVCADDLAAIAVIEAARAVGWSVPGDLSVVGCNDVPLASAINPALTTLRIDFASLGRLAVELLLARIFGRQEPGRRYIQPELVVRGSTAPPRRV